MRDVQHAFHADTDAITDSGHVYLFAWLYERWSDDAARHIIWQVGGLLQQGWVGLQQVEWKQGSVRERRTAARYRLKACTPLRCISVAQLLQAGSQTGFGIFGIFRLGVKLALASQRASNACLQPTPHLAAPPPPDAALCRSHLTHTHTHTHTHTPCS